MGLAAKNFEDLDAWQKAIDLAVYVYKATKTFPKSEQYSLTNQMRRAVASVSANLAEGFGRHSPKEKLQFYKIANGSLLEVKSFYYLANRLDYIDKSGLDDFLTLCVTTQKLINALIRSIREKHGL